MKLADCEHALGAQLRSRLANIGFDQTPDQALWFTKPNPRGADTLRFGGRRETEVCFFSGTAGLLLNEIERILRPESTRSAPTIMVPFHFLHESREFFEWKMSDAGESMGIAAAIVAEVETYALPFFEKYARIEDVRLSLKSPNPEEWFALTPEQRIALLAATECIGGDAKEALRILDQALAERATAPSKRRVAIEKLRAQVARSELFR